MNEAQVRELVQTVLDGVAPGADISGLGGRVEGPTIAVLSALLSLTWLRSTET